MIRCRPERGGQRAPGVDISNVYTNRKEVVIDWEAPLIVSRSLSFEILGSGKLLGANSISRLPQELELDALPVLMAFASGASPREALVRLREDWEFEDDGFETVVLTMIEKNFLTPRVDNGSAEAKALPALAKEKFASLLPHHAMLRDSVRVMSYRSAIERHCRGKVVVEIGCGTGILSMFAAQAGARRVIAIEESEIANVAREMFEANGCADVVELRLGNSRDVEIDEPADVIIHEILGVDPLAENMLPFISDARRRFLRPGGLLLPQRVEVFALGLEVPETPSGDNERMIAEAREFAGLYGLRFEPFLRRIRELDSRYFLPRVQTGEGIFFEPKVLTEECRLFDIDLSADDLTAAGLSQHLKPHFEVVRDGTLAGIVLYFRAHLDDTVKLSTSPFAPHTSWGWDARPLRRRQPVAIGDQVALDAGIGTWLGQQRLNVDLVAK